MRLGVRQVGMGMALITLALLWGCGSSGPSPSTSRGALALSIQFPPSSRATGSSRQQPTSGIPAGTASVKVELTDPTSGDSLAPSQLLPAPTSGGTATAHFDTVRPGAVHVKVSAYPDPNGAQPPIGFGSADTTVQSGQTSAVTVSVLPTISSLTLTQVPNPLAAGSAAITLTATATDAQENTLTGYPFTWTSSNNIVATITPSTTNPATASLRPLQAGTTTITVQEPNSGKTATATVTVTGSTTGGTTGTTSSSATTAGTTTSGTSTAGTSTAGTSTSSTSTTGSTSSGPLSGRVFAATSFNAATEPVFDITGGAPVSFATVNAGGWVGPLAVSPNGHLWVATNASGGSIYDITAGGDLTTATPLAQQLFGSSLRFIEGFTFDSAGNAYVASSENSTPTPLAVVSPAGTISTTSTTYSNPTGLAVVGTDLYISEAGVGRVVKHSLSTGTDTSFATGFPAGTSNRSGQIAVTPAGNILVLWNGNSGPGVFDITNGGDFTNQAPHIPVNFAIDVNQITVDSQGRIYAAGNNSGNVFEAPSGATAFRTFATGLGDTESVVAVR